LPSLFLQYPIFLNEQSYGANGCSCNRNIKNRAATVHASMYVSFCMPITLPLAAVPCLGRGVSVSSLQYLPSQVPSTVDLPINTRSSRTASQRILLNVQCKRSRVCTYNEAVAKSNLSSYVHLQPDMGVCITLPG
jgi:hypothetical protein